MHLLRRVFVPAMLITCPLALAEEQDPSKKVVAEVNGQAITNLEVGRELAPVFHLLRQKYPHRGERFRKELKDARSVVINEIIDRSIMLQELKKMGRKVTDAEVDAEIKKFTEKSYGGNEDRFLADLKGLDLDLAKYREIIRQKILITGFKKERFEKDDGPITDAEVEAYYGENAHDMRDKNNDLVTFRKIFIPSKDMKDPRVAVEAQLALAKQLAGDLKKGADFAELARMHSKGAFANQGGLIKNVPRRDLSVDFADRVFGADEGSIMGPVESKVGFTIFTVVNKKYALAPALDEGMKQFLRERITLERQDKRFQEWLAPLKKKAQITIH